MNPQTYKNTVSSTAIPNFFLDNKNNIAPRMRNEREITRPNLQVVSRQKETPLAPTHNLPLLASAIVGRDREVAECVALLRRDLSLLTLTGTGGTGKTRLALQVAHELVNDFEDGTFFVSLTAISDPALVPTTIALTLGIKEGGKPILDLLKEWLSARQVLLVLDNFEQVVSAAPLLTELLVVAPGLKILVTSREVLRVYGEREYPVTPLAVPDPKEMPSLRQLSENGAVSLFVQRARSVKPDFALTESNAQAIAEICVRLDGLPLAIELAAARSKLFTPQALLARLSNALDLLVTNMRDMPLRQQKLRSAFDWSYTSLEPAEKTIFTWMAVFVKGCTLEAAEAVFSGFNNPDFEDYAILDILSSLVDKSMLQLVNGKNDEPRFGMLETLREYAQERLTGTPEEYCLHMRHAEYFLDLAEKAEPGLIGPDQTSWVERLDPEQANFRASLEWLLENNRVVQANTPCTPAEPSRYLEMAARMVGSLARLWNIRSQTTESRRGFETVLTKISDRTSLPLAIMHKTLSGAGSMAYIQGDYPASLAWYQEALDLNKANGDNLGTARILRDMGLVKAYAGECREALDLFEEALVVHEQLNDRWGMGVTLLNQGLTSIGADNLELAETSLNEAYKIFTDVKETRGSSYVLNNLGYVALLRGEFARATDLLLQSLRLKQTFNDRLGISWSLDGLAAILARRGQFEKAAYFLSAANKLRDLVCSPLTYFGHKLNTPTLALVREGLDEETYRKALTAGYNQSLDEMLAESYSLEGTIEDRRQDARVTTKTTQSLPIVPRNSAATEEISRSRSSSLKLIDTLTSREIEVLRTVALGLSNQQVAEKLVIAPRTVNVHLTSIYGKLGVTSRTEATRFAFENNLV
ncbi:MAG: tetratricopeptide repeat protein [Chloroflexi bacterium]|nr:tetratricopeptide repeat protein [Chloroflexota bacterium]OJV92532.1 MAG: hypothetical protein BGO39_31995 [Chloroflexi bacterium 54-19]